MNTNNIVKKEWCVRQIILLTGVCMIILSNPFALNAFEIDEGKEVNITAASSYTSRYIWRGFDLYGDNDGAIQPSIDISTNALRWVDISFNLWSSWAIDSGHEEADEIDYSVSISRDVCDFLNVSTGYVYFDYPNANSLADVNEFWGSISILAIPGLEEIPLSTTIWAGYDFPVDSGGPERGWYFSLTEAVEVELPKVSEMLDAPVLGSAITIGGTDGVGGVDAELLSYIQYSLSMTIGKGNVSFGPSLHYVDNFEDTINDNDEIWVSCDFSVGF